MFFVRDPIAAIGNLWLHFVQKVIFLATLYPLFLPTRGETSFSTSLLMHLDYQGPLKRLHDLAESLGLALFSFNCSAAQHFFFFFLKQSSNCRARLITPVVLWVEPLPLPVFCPLLSVGDSWGLSLCPMVKKVQPWHSNWHWILFFFKFHKALSMYFHTSLNCFFYGPDQTMSFLW